MTRQKGAFPYLCRPRPDEIEAVIREFEKEWDLPPLGRDGVMETVRNITKWHANWSTSFIYAGRQCGLEVAEAMFSLGVRAPLDEAAMGFLIRAVKYRVSVEFAIMALSRCAATRKTELTPVIRETIAGQVIFFAHEALTHPEADSQNKRSTDSRGTCQKHWRGCGKWQRDRNCDDPDTFLFRLCNGLFNERQARPRSPPRAA
jgi:hypothetical protein